MNVNDNLTNDSQIILNAFNKYFLTVAENINVENLYDKNSLLNNTSPLEYLLMHSSNRFQILYLSTQPQTTFFILELEVLTNFHQLSLIYQMM
jgi:hypothetical protein